MSPGVVVTGIGMVSSLGRDAVSACAAARAGLSRAGPIVGFEVYDEQEWDSVQLIGHAAAGVSQGFQGFGKLVRLGSLALTDLVRDSHADLSTWSDLGLFLNLSSRHFERHQQDLREREHGIVDGAFDFEEWQAACREGLIRALTHEEGLSVSPENQRVYFGDHSGMVTALADATSQLLGGSMGACIVGGLDSYIEPDLLAAADAEGLVKTPGNPSGFMPGEGGAFVLLESSQRATARGAPVQGALEAFFTAKDTSHRLSGDPSTGSALASTIVGCLEQLTDRGDRIALVMGSLNGDPFGASEWGHALARLSPGSSIRDASMWYPAASFGETGAATGALAICLAIRGFARDYAPGYGALVWLSSSDGSKGSFHIKPP